MRTTWFGAIVKPKALLLVLLSGPAVAQQVSFALLPPPKAIEPAAFVKPAEPVTLP
jgi:hypothetical protein